MCIFSIQCLRTWVNYKCHTTPFRLPIFSYCSLVQTLWYWFHLHISGLYLVTGRCIAPNVGWFNNLWFGYITTEALTLRWDYNVLIFPHGPNLVLTTTLWHQCSAHTIDFWSSFQRDLLIMGDTILLVL